MTSTSLTLANDQTNAVTAEARQKLATLWTFAQSLPEDQAQSVSQELVAVYKDIQALQTITQDQAQTLQDAASVFTGIIGELRTQRNDALDDLQSVRRTASAQARTDLARDLAMELDCSVIDAQRLIDALVGRSDVAVSGYTMMDLRDTLRRMLDEITEELVCSGTLTETHL